MQQQVNANVKFRLSGRTFYDLLDKQDEYLQTYDNGRYGTLFEPFSPALKGGFFFIEGQRQLFPRKFDDE